MSAAVAMAMALLKTYQPKPSRGDCFALLVVVSGLSTNLPLLLSNGRVGGDSGVTQIRHLASDDQRRYYGSEDPDRDRSTQSSSVRAAVLYSLAREHVGIHNP